MGVDNQAESVLERNAAIANVKQDLAGAAPLAKWLNATGMPKQKKQHSRAEIAKKLAQANRLARQGKLQSEIARTLGVSVMTLHRWRKALIGPPTRSGDQIAQLQLEISLLRRLVTDLLLLEKIKRRSQRPSWRR
jgi:DNA invertase Pin-like site-specific DNA recombinase